MKTFLIVDDSAVTRAVLKKTIEMLEFPVSEILEAENSRKALTLLQDNPVDLIMADMNMPEMNGMEFAAAVRNDPRFRETPFVVITAEVGEKIRSELREKNIFHYIHKPFKPEQIRGALADIFEDVPVRNMCG